MRTSVHVQHWQKLTATNAKAAVALKSKLKGDNKKKICCKKDRENG